MSRTPKKEFFVLAFLLVMASVSAFDIQSPERVPGFSPFTFRAVLPATNLFTQAQVQFDGIAVATIYPTGACSIQPDWIPFLIHCATFDADTQTNEGLTAVITHTGFANGIHTITVSTQGIQSENKTVSVNVFDALDTQARNDLNAQIETIRTNVGTLQTDTQTNQENIYGTKEELNQTIAENNERLNTIEEKIGTIEQNPVLKTNSQTESTGFQIPFLNSSQGVGLASGATAPLFGIMILIAGLIFVFFFVQRQKTKKGFGGGHTKTTPFFEGNLDALFKGMPGSEKTGEQVDPQPKKWSSDIEDELREDVESNPPEKINFSDILKKERE